MSFSGLRGPVGGRDADLRRAGVHAPQQMARAARAVAMFTVLGGVVGLVLLWPDGDADPATYATALGALASALLGAFWLWMAAVGLDWLAARYQQARDSRPGMG